MTGEAQLSTVPAKSRNLGSPSRVTGTPEFLIVLFCGEKLENITSVYPEDSRNLN